MTLKFQSYKKYLILFFRILISHHNIMGNLQAIPFDHVLFSGIAKVKGGFHVLSFQLKFNHFALAATDEKSLNVRFS